MRYLIDGYNLLFFLVDSNKTLQSQRQKVIYSVQQEFSHLGLKGMVVFDGAHHPVESGVSYKTPLVIAYSPEGRSADEYILEQIESARTPGEITVVSDDRQLQKSAQELGSKILSLSQFVGMLEKKRKRKQILSREKSQFKETPNQFQRLLKIFESLDDE